METEVKQPETLNGYFQELLGHSPRVITQFTPANKLDQQRLFLRGEIRNPDHIYASLNELDIESAHESVEEINDAIMAHDELDPKFAPAYEDLASGYHKSLQLLEAARAYKAAEPGDERDALRETYMRLNIEAYGEPNEDTYRAILQEKLEELNKKQLSGRGQEIRSELFQMVDFEEGKPTPEAFRPSEETVRWVSEAAKALYGDMLAHVPEDKEKFTPEEICVTFQEIVDEEFGEAAAGWQVKLANATSITVKATQREIVIPRDRMSISNKELRELVAHELGVHLLRTVMGSETDLDPLAFGLRNFYDSEEGLGVVMGQVANGKFEVAGKDHYITAGAAYFDGMDFRDAFELQWRLRLLDQVDDNKVISELKIAEAKKWAYVKTSRIFRGTDDLPWFKDLSYYNGAMDMWRHLESIRGDDTKFMFVLLGKANPANISHERIMYETATK